MRASGKLLFTALAILGVSVGYLLARYRFSLEYAYRGPVSDARARRERKAAVPTAVPVVTPALAPARTSALPPIPTVPFLTYTPALPGTTPPMPVTEPSLDVPEHLKGRQITGGLIVLEGLVTETGEVRDIRLLRSVQPDLDRAAIAATSTARYRPAQLNGKPVPFRMIWTHRIEVR
jgi:TonB family protein